MEEIKILVVEDEAIVAKDIKVTLESLGYTVPAIAASGAMAIKQAAETHPDLVLMDIVLRGDMDGIEAAEQIRRQFDIPVVFLTAYSDEQTFHRAKVQEPYGYILKPFEKRGLSINIEMALYKHRSERQLRKSEDRYRGYSRNLTLLNRMSQALNTTLDFPQILEQLLRAAVDIADAEGSSVWMWDEQRVGELICQAMLVDGRYTSPCELRLRPGEGVAGWVAQNGRSTLVGDVHVDARFFPGVDQKTGFNTISILAVPLRMRDHIQGVLEVVNKRRGVFDGDDRFLVETLAASAASAIDNARLVEALRLYAVELESRNQELDAFAHTAAHDLKNPLARIVGFAEFLVEDHAKMPEKDLQRHLYVIAQNGRRMDNIIDELLLLAGVRQMEKVEFAPLDMPRILAGAQERLADLIEKHQAAIIWPETWPVVHGYGPWVEEVWVNYLSNAIQYGGRPPQVELGVTTEEDGSVRLWVRDNGGGLTQEEQARLFTPFTRFDQVRARGHGLGLSIVRRIVERLGGQVVVESQVGEGSVFSFILPGAAR